MDTLEKKLTERLQRAAVDIPLPTAGAADDVRRGAARLRKRRGFEAGGAALAALAITGGFYAAGGPGDRATDSAPPVAEQETPAPSEDEPFVVEIDPDGKVVVPPGRHSEDEWEGYTYEPPQVQAAVDAFEAAVLDRLDPEGPGGGPDLVAVPTDGFMGEEVRIEGDVATLVVDPSMMSVEFELSDGTRQSRMSLSVEDVALGEQRSGETPPPGGWDDSCDPRLTCTEIDRAVIGNASGMVIEKDGELVRVTLERPDGITVSLGLVDQQGKEEVRLPWSALDLIAVLVDPALELPSVD